MKSTVLSHKPQGFPMAHHRQLKALQHLVMAYVSHQRQPIVFPHIFNEFPVFHLQPIIFRHEVSS